MPKIAVRNLEGKDAGELALSEAVFGVPANDALVHQVYVALSANLRSPIAHAKTRAERAGSGAKPWRQKGTGRARVGSKRTPVWRKGGVVFGPTKDRNFTKNLNRKMRQKAVAVALSEKVRSGRLVVIDALTLAEPKTKLFANALKALGIAGRGLVVGFAPAERPIERAVRNLARIEHSLAKDLSVKDLLDREYLLLSKAAVTELETRFKDLAVKAPKESVRSKAEKPKA